jgi:hypothetical protein
MKKPTFDPYYETAAATTRGRTIMAANQWSDASREAALEARRKKAKTNSVAAFEKSNKAISLSDHEEARLAHDNSEKEHRDIAIEYKKNGDRKSSREHYAKAADHYQKAREHFNQ